ncbi:MAG: aminopeptidase N [Pseudomonadota bacterium]
MRTDTSPGQTPTLLADYAEPDWWVEEVSLVFDLDPKATLVKSRIVFSRNTGKPPAPLTLHGRKLTLRGCAIDGAPVEPEVTGEGLTVAGALPQRFVWTCETEIDPGANTELEGLYLSKGMYCTQCEAEGFRKITYYPDRPDVMAPFTVRIEAPDNVPVLLSNGNPGESGALEDGRHFAEWHDPHPKPAYLFALVAGDLVSFDASFTTISGKLVDLRVWVRLGDEGKCAYAMDSLIRSMRWDEQAYGCEYDLDIFQIVAVDDFNMGAMENKGLNIFNSKYVLASPETATDRDYELIESIVAHEYFHNWTGNRITCRDWFQLCLKEGLTVFRDQCFSADERSAPVQRIQDVKQLRARQFREDQGPLAHPVRPEEYVEINNFYTATVYEKGAEVIRMLHLLVGAEGYRRALDLYFKRHDGQACTIEQFRQCFEDACEIDLTHFARWWGQAGTPVVTVEEEFADGTYTLTLAQETPATPGQTDKLPQMIPVVAGLLGSDGAELVESQTLLLTEARQSFAFEGLPERPVASLLRGFSAPVVLNHARDEAALAVLLGHDTDPFNRWEAGRQYAQRIAFALLAGETEVPAAWIEGFGNLLEDQTLDPAFRALALDLPGEDELAGEIAANGGYADPDAIHTALTTMRRALGKGLAGPLAATYELMQVPGAYSPDAESAGMRALRDCSLGLLMSGGHGASIAQTQFDEAGNMTDQFGALALLVRHAAPGREDALARFHAQWRHDPLVLDKWFSLQASNPQPGAVARVETLTDHADFDWKNPNRFRSVIAVFAMANPTGFHVKDGAGYALLADWLIKLDPVNPQTTARIAGCFETWRRYDPDRQALMQAEISRVLSTPDLSRNTTEILSRIAGS